MVIDAPGRAAIPRWLVQLSPLYQVSGWVAQIVVWPNPPKEPEPTRVSTAPAAVTSSSRPPKTLQACAFHPGISERILYTLTSLPGALVWGSVLFLLWLVIGEARRTGPFTAQVAVAMRRLGWLIIAGSAAAAAVQGFAQDQLLNTMLVAPAHGRP